MAKDSLFKRLTKLFRSGPVVRRKVKALDTRIAVPDRYTNATALFQKSQSPIYSSIMASAHNTSERFMRYQDFQEMEMCLAGDTLIAVPNGYKTIKALADEYGTDKEFVVYAYDHNQKKIVPAIGKQARQTVTAESFKVTFDNGQTIIGTGNHRLLKRDGTFCVIEELVPGDAMMPFYRREMVDKKTKKGMGYQYIYTMNKDETKSGWRSEHRVIAEFVLNRKLQPGEVVHHINFDRKDNRPENLRIMSEVDHQELHRENVIALNTKKWSKENSEWIEQFKLNHSKFMTENNPAERKDITFGRILETAENVGFNLYKLSAALDTDMGVIYRRLEKNGYANFETFAKAYNPSWQNAGWDNKGDKNPRFVRSITFDKICSVYKKGMRLHEVAKELNVSTNIISGRLRDRGYKRFNEFAASYQNLKVVSVEPNGVIPLYDLTVDGYKNFATDSVISHNTPELASALDIYCLAGDTRIPLLDGSKPTVKELYDSQKENFSVFSFDIDNGNHTVGNCLKAKKTGKDQKIFKVVLDNNKSVRLTENHLVLLLTGKYKAVKDLQQGDAVNGCEIMFTTPDPTLAVTIGKKSNTIKEIVEDGIEDVYDLEVEKYHNFAICGNESDDSYIMVHNSDETVATDEKGRALHVYSEDEKVKSILDDLFYNTLNVEFNLRSWVRNLVKYGDFFAFIDVSPDHGIMNVIPIPVNEIEREEGYDRNDPLAVRFRWTQMGNRVLENWEVAHFRLLGNDMYLPYGSSVIDPARRIWRQLILIEDAMLTYRVSRAPERRVFYIDVGNIEPEAIPTYVEQQRQQLRTNPVVDKSTGRTDLRFNAMCLSLKNQVKLQDGRFITLGDFIKEWESGKTDQWVYSVDQETKAIVPGKVVWAGITRKDAELVRVTLDDGSYLDTTPDHRFMKRDGSYCEAKDLAANDALMPLYTKVSTKKDKNIVGYEMLYNPFTEKYEFTHRVNANAELFEQREEVERNTDWKKNHRLVVHHASFNKLNNSPQNLQWIGENDHIALHAANITEYNKSEKKRLRTSFLNKKYNSVAAMAGYNGSSLHKKHNTIRRAAQQADWSDPAKKEQRSVSMRWNITDAMFERLVSIVSENVTNSRGTINELLLADSEFRKGLEASKLGRDINKFSTAAWCGEIKRRGYAGLGDFKKSLNAGYKNHKVVSVEFLSHREDTGCITVEKYHNFAAGGNDDCQSDKSSKLLKSMVFLHNSVDEDFFIPTRGGDSGTKIDTLPGGTNTAAVEDVAYIQKKMFAALKIPSAYLGYDEALSSKAGLAQLDIRFSRTISAIQRVVISELNKLAIIHLVANGYEGDELLNFVLKLSNPSTIAQQQKLELYRAKFEIAGSAPEGLVDRNYLRKNILGLTDDEIESIERGKSIDRASDMKLEQEAALNATPSGGGGGAGGDLFADTGGDTTAGAEDDLGGETEPADAAAADTEPPPENASEEPPEEEDPGIDLLSDADDPNSPAASLKLKPGQNPLKASSQLSKSLYNRGRRRTHGASKTHMPDLAKMTGNDTPESSDPHDMAWLKAVVSNPMGESQENRIKPKLTSDVKRMIANMGSQFGWSQPHSQVNNSLLTEETEIENNSNSTKGLEEFDVIITGEDDGDS